MLAGGTATQIHMEYFNVPANECVKFTIYDNIGNGICCAYGHGYFILYDSNNNAIFGDEDDGEFGSEATILLSVKGESAIVIGATEVEVLNYTDANFITEPVEYEGYPEEVGFEYQKEGGELQTVEGIINEFYKIMATVNNLEASSTYTVYAYAKVNGTTYYGTSTTFNTWTEGVNELENSLRASVIYHRKAPADLRRNGMLIYVPINEGKVAGVHLDDAESMRAVGISESYIDWVTSFRKYLKVVRTGERQERTLLDIISGTVRDDFEQAIYDAIDKTRLDGTDCYITADENYMPLLVMPEDKQKLTAHVCQKIYTEIDGLLVDYGIFYFEPEDFPIPYEGFWQRMRDDWLFINNIMCPFYMEEKTELANGRTAVYGYTKMCRNGDEGALFLRLVYDEVDEIITVEPLCFQKVDFTQQKLQFGRVEPVSNLNSEDIVYFCCSSCGEKADETFLVRVTEDMKWGDITKFELKRTGELEGFMAAYVAIDLYANVYDLDFR